MAWNECWPEGGTPFKYSACDNNATQHVAVASFVPYEDMPDFVGLQATVDIQAVADSLPDWWQFWNAGSCRQTSISASADFTQSPQTACVDAFTGLGVGGIASYWTASHPPPPQFAPTPDVRSARLRVAFGIPSPVAISAQNQYYAFSLRINGAKTTGPGACAGCGTPVCIVVNTIWVLPRSGVTQWLVSELENKSAGWQCAHATWPTGCWAPLGEPPCSTPTRNRTWGEIKSLYR